MRRLSIVFAGLAASFAAACASGYSDFNTGLSARLHGRCDLALPHLDSALASTDLVPALRPVAYLVRAQCHRSQEDADAALADLNASLSARPNDYDTLRERGEVLVGLHRFDEAEADFKAMAGLRPNLTSARTELGLLYLAAKRYDDAIWQFSAIVQSGEPDQDRADGDFEAFLGLLLRARAKLDKGDFDGSMADADRLVEISRNAAQGHAARAEVYDAKGDYAHALSEADVASDDGNDSLYAMLKGVAQFQSGRYADAEVSFAAVPAKSRDYPYAVLWTHLARLAAGKADAGLADRAKALKTDKWPYALVRLYLGQATPQDVSQAISAKPGYHDVQSCEAAFYVGAWQSLQGDKAGAVASFKDAVARCTLDNYEALAARSEIGRQQ